MASGRSLAKELAEDRASIRGPTARWGTPRPRPSGVRLVGPCPHGERLPLDDVAALITRPSGNGRAAEPERGSIVLTDTETVDGDAQGARPRRTSTRIRPGGPPGKFDPRKRYTQGPFPSETFQSPLRRRVSADVHPVVLLCRNVAGDAVGFVVGRHVQLRVLGGRFAQPQPSPHRSLLGKRPLTSLTITNQLLTAVDQVGCPVLSFAESTSGDLLYQGAAPSANLPSRWVRSYVLWPRVDVVHLMDRLVRLPGHSPGTQKVQELVAVIGRQRNPAVLRDIGREVGASPGAGGPAGCDTPGASSAATRVVAAKQAASASGGALAFMACISSGLGGCRCSFGRDRPGHVLPASLLLRGRRTHDGVVLGENPVRLGVILMARVARRG